MLQIFRFLFVANNRVFRPRLGERAKQHTVFLVMKTKVIEKQLPTGDGKRHTLAWSDAHPFLPRKRNSSKLEANQPAKGAAAAVAAVSVEPASAA